MFDKRQLEAMVLLGERNMKDAGGSVKFYKLVLKQVLEHLTAGRTLPIDRLAIVVRKYHGSRESLPRKCFSPSSAQLSEN